MTFSQTLTDALKEAMKNRDEIAVSAIRSLKSALRYAAIGQSVSGDLDGADAIAVVRKQVRQRQDSLESFRGAGRNDLADREQAEIAVLERFLPPPLSVGELELLVRTAIGETGATSRAQMGRIIALVQERAGGRADSREISRTVMRLLS